MFLLPFNKNWSPQLFCNNLFYTFDISKLYQKLIDYFMSNKNKTPNIKLF
ncbi:uncharacterized protein YhbP (UPF0306 family) [Arcicella rosea]|uniref:Uncharacterized protein YhbP (UPF0306 family) n=1 Tax=Arcicella rosea TaxID=502909 RepID=A0A841EN28_9BACT|nr:uncharacterized protein YhbP (UPF0306 family) [Arcicella rosea]